MPTQEDSVFARIAVHNKLLSQQEISSCMEEVEKAASDGKTLLLSDVVFHSQLLSQERVNAVSWAVQYALTKSRDRGHADILRDKKLATTNQINQALESQQQFFKREKQVVSILDLLANKGVIKREKIVEVMREAENQEGMTADALIAKVKKASAGDDIKVERAGGCKVAIQEVSLSTGRKVSCLGVSGMLDADSFAGLQKIIGKVVRKPGDEGKYLILNLEGVNYMSSAGVGVIISANKDVLDKGGTLMLVNIKDEVREIMTLVSLDAEFGFYTMDEALRKMARVK